MSTDNRFLDLVWRKATIWGVVVDILLPLVFLVPYYFAISTLVAHGKTVIFPISPQLTLYGSLLILVALICLLGTLKFKILRAPLIRTEQSMEVDLMKHVVTRLQLLYFFALCTTLSLAALNFLLSREPLILLLFYLLLIIAFLVIKPSRSLLLAIYNSIEG